MNKDKVYHGFTIGQIVYLFMPGNSLLQTGSRKITCNFTGPLVSYKTLSPNQFLLMSLDGYIYPIIIEESRIKPGLIRTTKGNVSTLSELKQVIRTGIRMLPAMYSILIDEPHSSPLETMVLNFY